MVNNFIYDIRLLKLTFEYVNYALNLQGMI